MLQCGTVGLTHSEACGCGDVGAVERVQNSSAAHIQQPGLLFQQQGAVVPGRAEKMGAAQQTCGDTEIGILALSSHWLGSTSRPNLLQMHEFESR